MKRAAEEELVRASKPDGYKIIGTRLSLEEIIAEACYTVNKEGQYELPNTPIVLEGVTDDVVISQLAFWPKTVAICTRFMKLLDDSIHTNESKHVYGDNVEILNALLNVQYVNEPTKEDLEFMLKSMDIESLSELGLFKMIVFELDPDCAVHYVYRSDLAMRLYTKTYTLFC
jgi:hypothetical protein